MFKWKKLGRILNPEDIRQTSWMKEYAQTPSVIIFQGHIRVYFCSRSFPDQNQQYISHLAYIDLRRDNLFEIINICKKPLLDLGDLGTFDEFGIYPASAIKDGSEIRVYYGGVTRCVSVPFNAAIGLAISNDGGETFTKIGRGPVLSYSPDEPFVLGSPRIRKFNDVWYLWYSAGKKWIKKDGIPQPIYKIRMATSIDGIEWKKIGKDLIEIKLEENECQASPDVFFFRGTYHMFFSYRYGLDYKSKGRGYTIGYAFSDDLTHWTRDDTQVEINLSKDGWDSEMICYGHVFKLDEKIYMIYQGNQFGKAGIGLAELVD